MTVAVISGARLPALSPVLEVVELAHRVQWRDADQAGHVTEALQVGAVAYIALDRPPAGAVVTSSSPRARLPSGA